MVDEQLTIEDEWTDSADNEPDIVERIIAGDLNAMMHNLDLCIREQAQNEFDRLWAQAIAREEKGDEQ